MSAVTLKLATASVSLSLAASSCSDYDTQQKNDAATGSLIGAALGGATGAAVSNSR